MEGIKLGKYEASIRARELERLYKLEEIHALVPSLREIASHKRIVVLVDELDRGWDSSEDARAFVAGLFQACISVNMIVGFLLAEGGRGNGRRRAGSVAFLGVHQVPHLNIAAARNFQVHPMFWAHLGSGNGAR